MIVVLLRRIDRANKVVNELFVSLWEDMGVDIGVITLPG